MVKAIIVRFANSHFKFWFIHLFWKIKFDLKCLFGDSRCFNPVFCWHGGEWDSRGCYQWGLRQWVYEQALLWQGGGLGRQQQLQRGGGLPQELWEREVGIALSIFGETWVEPDRGYEDCCKHCKAWLYWIGLSWFLFNPMTCRGFFGPPHS